MVGTLASVVGAEGRFHLKNPLTFNSGPELVFKRYAESDVSSYYRGEPDAWHKSTPGQFPEWKLSSQCVSRILKFIRKIEISSREFLRKKLKFLRKHVTRYLKNRCFGLKNKLFGPINYFFSQVRSIIFLPFPLVSSINFRTHSLVREHVMQFKNLFITIIAIFPKNLQNDT